MTDYDERASLQELFMQYRSDLHHLEMHAATYGGVSFAPLEVVNKLSSIRKQIADLEARLRQLDTSSRPDSQDSRSAISFGQGNNQQGMNVHIGGDVAGGNIIKGNTVSTGEASVDLPRLRQLLVQFFNDGELRDLCFDLGIDYDNLPGSGKSDKARELVAYAQRRGIMANLLAACRQQRPHAPWSGTPTSDTTATATQPKSQPEPQSSDRGTQQAQAQTVASTKNPPTQVTLSFQLQGDETRIAWESSLIGIRSTIFVPPYPEEEVLPLVIKALDAVQHLNHPVGGPQFKAEEKAVLNELGLWQNERVPPSAHKTVGQAIYRALGPDGKSALETVRSFGIAQGVQINYVLRFPREAVSLAALPWEALWDQDQAVLLSRGNDVDSCERYMNIDRALPPPLAAGQKLHVLALTPTFGISDKIRQAEREARLATWDGLKEQELMTYDEVGGPLTVRKLTDYLRKAPRRPDIIHYFGHGIYKNGEGYLLFDDGAEGKSLVSSTRLAAMLGDVRLMVILACESAMVEEEGGLLTGVAPALSLVTGAVVAMQLSVRITAATRFSEIFYDELLSLKHSLQDAVAEARQTLFFEEDDGASWYVPTLYIRSREQNLVYIAA